MVLSIKTQDIVNDLQNLSNLFDFSNLNRDHELFSEENKKVVGKFEFETPESIWINEFVYLRSKAYSNKRGDKKENKLKCISKTQSKNINFERVLQLLVWW